MEGIDTTVPHSARVWNYWLGGKDNFPVDQELGDQFREVFPGIVDLARFSRAFLARAVTYLVKEEGIRQFLDIGTGLPTHDNTHEVAQRAAPDSRIVYVDNDPLVLAHARALLTSTSEGATAYIDADLHQPEAILEQAGRTLNLREPVALIVIQTLGHISPENGDAEARGILRRLLDKLPPGSFLALNDSADTNQANVEATRKQYNESGAVPYHLRSPGQIVNLFEGLEMVPPGVLPIERWRPAAPVAGTSAAPYTEPGAEVSAEVSARAEAGIGVRAEAGNDLGGEVGVHGGVGRKR
ncbi:SAM-dependent methyltransferase [Actinomadura sp. 9N407]|uniref:SAM-dependent methyltransferase n=1 Tax=Actinomadura sp. 9N407 TaxID=3375154 RepID=UPI003788753C